MCECFVEEVVDDLSEVPFGWANRDGGFNRLVTELAVVEQFDVFEEVELVERGRACFVFIGSFSGMALGSRRKIYWLENRNS